MNIDLLKVTRSHNIKSSFSCHQGFRAGLGKCFLKCCKRGRDARIPWQAKELLVNPNKCRIINPGLKRFLLLKLQCGLFPPRHHNSSASFTKDPQWGPAPFPPRADREPALTPWRKQRISRGLVRYRQLSAHQCLASLRTPHECTLIKRAREMRTVCKHAHTHLCEPPA